MLLPRVQILNVVQGKKKKKPFFFKKKKRKKNLLIALEVDGLLI
jgi:hypothetical protein